MFKLIDIYIKMEVKVTEQFTCEAVLVRKLTVQSDIINLIEYLLNRH